MRDLLLIKFVDNRRWNFGIEVGGLLRHDLVERDINSAV